LFNNNGFVWGGVPGRDAVMRRVAGTGCVVSVDQFGELEDSKIFGLGLLSVMLLITMLMELQGEYPVVKMTS